MMLRKEKRHVYLGFGINHFRVFGIFVFTAVYHSICKTSN